MTIDVIQILMMMIMMINDDDDNDIFIGFDGWRYGESTLSFYHLILFISLIYPMASRTIFPEWEVPSNDDDEDDDDCNNDNNDDNDNDFGAFTASRNLSKTRVSLYWRPNHLGFILSLGIGPKIAAVLLKYFGNIEEMSCRLGDE